MNGIRYAAKPVMLLAAALIAAPAFAQQGNIDWAKMDEDRLIMGRLVQDTLEEAVRTPVKPEDLPAEMYDMMLQEGRTEGEIRRIALQATPVRSRYQLKSGVESLYLPGYGVLLHARMGFPLSPLAAPSPSPTPPETGRWQKAREDVLGIPRLPTRPSPPSYDAEIVGKIKDALAELLSQEAKNFQELSGGEQVTVFLYGPADTGVSLRISGTVSRASVPGLVAEMSPPSAPEPPDVPSVERDSALKEMRAAQEATTEARRRVERAQANARKPITRTLTGLRYLSGRDSGDGTSYRSAIVVSVKASDLAAQREGRLSAEQVKEKVEIRQCGI